MKAKTEAKRWYKNWKLERDIAWKEWRREHEIPHNIHKKRQLDSGRIPRI